MKENVAFLKTPEAAPGKVIPTSPTALQKLADSLASCTSALATAEREQRDASAILSEAAPAAFDHAAAGRSVAEARVSDLLNGGSTADGVQAQIDRDRAAAEAELAAHAKRQADARAQLERAGPMIVALRAQALELDRAVRRELARLGRENHAEAAQALADAVTAYAAALIEFRAVVWLQAAEAVGAGGRQFESLVESTPELTVPAELHDALPPGWAPTSTRDTVRYDRYDLAVAIGERRRALMEAATSGVYPKAGAALHRADQRGGEL